LTPKVKPTARTSEPKAQAKLAQTSERPSKQGQMASLVEQTEGLSIDGIEDPDESVIVRPSRKTRSSAASSTVLSSGSQSGEGKKKKRSALLRISSYI
jgi:hypothetical protein